MWIIILLIGFSIFVGWFASSKKRSGVGWFFLSLIISPLITFIVLLVIALPHGELKKCPKCAEEIKAEAQVCLFCGFDFSSPPAAEPAPTPPVKKVDTEVRDLATDYINKMSKKP
jgi:hypothetical protein